MPKRVINNPLKAVFDELSMDQMSAMIELLSIAKASRTRSRKRHVPTIERFHNGMRYIQCGKVKISAESGYRTVADMPDEIVKAIDAMYHKKRKRKKSK